MKNKIRAYFRRLLSIDYSPRYTRLAGDLASYKPLLDKRISETNSENKQWAIQAKILIKNAEEFLSKLKIDEGWKSLHTAQRLEVFGMLDEEKTALAEELQVECSKLNDWRKDAILRMLGTDKKPELNPPRSEVLVRALEIKDEHYNNQYYKNTLSRSMFQLLFMLLGAFITALIVYFSILVSNYGQDLSDYLSIAELLIGVLLFGFLGAITSAILFTRYSTRISRLTEIGSNTIITLSKIFVGASFSIFIFLIMKSSIAENIKLFNFVFDEPLDFFAVAFVSGFSERLAQRAIEAIVGKEKEK
jgi:hypothetical protein